MTSAWPTWATIKLRRTSRAERSCGFSKTGASPFRASSFITPAGDNNRRHSRPWSTRFAGLLSPAGNQPLEMQGAVLRIASQELSLYQGVAPTRAYLFTPLYTCPDDGEHSHERFLHNHASVAEGIFGACCFEHTGTRFHRDGADQSRSLCRPPLAKCGAFPWRTHCLRDRCHRPT